MKNVKVIGIRITEVQNGPAIGHKLDTSASIPDPLEILEILKRS